jgi:transposase
MGARKLINDSQRVKRDPSMAGTHGDLVPNGKDDRLFSEAVRWIMRTGSQWRDLPAELGDWHIMYARIKRWGESGCWRMILDAVSGDKDLEILMIECTVVRAHQHAAGAHKEQDTWKSGNWVVG